MDKDIIIRKAAASDIDSLRSLYTKLEKDAVKYQPEHFVVGTRSDSFFENIFQSDRQDILVAEEGSAVVGFIHVMILEQKNVSCLIPQTAVYIQDMIVSEEKRNHGIGTALIRAAKEYGAVHGADFMRVQVFPGNEAGIRFYERNGLCEMMKTMECQTL